MKQLSSVSYMVLFIGKTSCEDAQNALLNPATYVGYVSMVLTHFGGFASLVLVLAKWVSWCSILGNYGTKTWPQMSLKICP